MPYPGRPVLEVLPEFVGSGSIRQTPEQRARLLAFCAEQYAAGRSIHELAELRAALSRRCVERSTRPAFRDVAAGRGPSEVSADARTGGPGVSVVDATGAQTE